MTKQSAADNATTDNGDLWSKVRCREAALAWVPGSPAILEINAGEGHLYRAIWKAAASKHLGLDKRFSRGTGDPAGECWRGDNERILKRAVEAGPWDVVDIDTYANPWPLLRRLLHLAPARPLVVTATCTVERAMQVNSSDFAMAILGLGTLAKHVYHTGVPLSRWYNDAIRAALAWCQEGTPFRAVECKRIHADTKVAGSSSRTRYYALRYEVQN